MVLVAPAASAEGLRRIRHSAARGTPTRLLTLTGQSLPGEVSISLTLGILFSELEKRDRGGGIPLAPAHLRIRFYRVWLYTFTGTKCFFRQESSGKCTAGHRVHDGGRIRRCFPTREVWLVLSTASAKPAFWRRMVARFQDVARLRQLRVRKLRWGRLSPHRKGLDGNRPHQRRSSGAWQNGGAAARGSTRPPEAAPRRSRRTSPLASIPRSQSPPARKPSLEVEGSGAQGDARGIDYWRRRRRAMKAPSVPQISRPLAGSGTRIPSAVGPPSALISSGVSSRSTNAMLFK